MCNVCNCLLNDDIFSIIKNVHKRECNENNLFIIICSGSNECNILRWYKIIAKRTAVIKGYHLGKEDKEIPQP